jgi:hypothetical protein
MEGKNQWTPEMKSFKRKLENAVRECGGYSQNYSTFHDWKDGKLVGRKERQVCHFKRVADCKVFDDRTELLLRNKQVQRLDGTPRFNKGEYMFFGTNYCSNGYRIYSPNLDYQFTYVGYDGRRKASSFTDSDGCLRDAPGWGGHSAG